MKDFKYILSSIDDAANKYFDSSSQYYHSLSLYSKLWALLIEWEDAAMADNVLLLSGPQSKRNVKLNNMMNRDERVIRLANGIECYHEAFIETATKLINEGGYKIESGAKFTSFFITKASYVQKDLNKEAAMRSAAEYEAYTGKKRDVNNDSNELGLRFSNIPSGSSVTINLDDEQNTYSVFDYESASYEEVNASHDNDSEEYSDEERTALYSDTARTPYLVLVAGLINDLMKTGHVDQIIKTIYAKTLIDASRTRVDDGEEPFSEMIFNPSDNGFITRMTEYSYNTGHSYHRLINSNYSVYALESGFVTQTENRLKDYSIIKYLEPEITITKGTLSKRIDSFRTMIVQVKNSNADSD